MPFHHKYAAAFTAGLLLAATTAGAETREIAKPATAALVDLGSGTSALTYWVDAADGRHVVTTVDTVTPAAAGQGEDHHAVVRFSAVLLPGQSQTVSVPATGAAQAQELKLSRSDNGIVIEQVQAARKTASLD